MDFVPTIATLAAFAAAVVALTFTPGPDMALFLGKAVAQGRSAGLAAMLGAMAGILVHTTLVAIGLSALLATRAVWTRLPAMEPNIAASPAERP